MKRLVRKSEMLDTYNRDDAIAYINGQIFVDETHAQCVNAYLEEIESDKDLDNDRRRPEESELKQVDVDEFAFAHLLEEDKIIDGEGQVSLQAGIYIELSTLINIGIHEVANAIQQEYPEYDIFEIDGDINSSEDVEKITV